MLNFNNNVSEEGFVGNYNTPEEVIASGSQELKDCNGSFKAIANRIKKILKYAWDSKRDPNYLDKILNSKIDDKVEIIFRAMTKGYQECPFEKCGFKWSDVVEIRNPNTNKKLIINEGTEHLVRKHHLLEKGNSYGITAKEFYEHFM